MAIESKAITQGFILISVLLMGIFMAISVTTNATGGLAAMIPLITVILSLIAIVKPRIGLFGLAGLVIWVDEFKRLAVYYGGAYSITVFQTLAMPFIVLAALNVGFFTNILFGKAKIDKIGIAIYAIATAIGGMIFVVADGTVPEKVQRAANISAYLTLIPIVYTYLKSFDEWRNFFAFQVLVATPSALWAIQQYHYGFNEIEWEYARSGLSAVHYSQMFLIKDPRVFGLFGSASALGCISVYCFFAWWHGINYPRWRYAWILIAILLTWTLFITTQRSALFSPLIFLVCAFLFRTQLRIISSVAVALTLYVGGIMSSDYIINEGLDKINRTIASETEWGTEVLNVNTFSDRIRGWQRLKKPESWTLLGSSSRELSQVDRYDVSGEFYNHDVMNKILINTGIVGLFLASIPIVWLLWSFNRVVKNAPNCQTRNQAAFIMAISLPIIALSMIGGDNFNTNPINLQIWTAFGGIFVCRSAFLKGQIIQKENLASNYIITPEVHSPQLKKL